MEKSATESPSKILLSSPPPRPLANNVNLTSPVNPHSAMVAQNYTAPVGPTDAVNLLKIRNVVSTVSVGCDLDLQTVNFRTRTSEYTPSRFHGVVMRLREPKCTALIFRTGKIICTGGRDEYEAHLASRKFAGIIQKLGYDVKFRRYKIQSIVATVDLQFPIRLENLNQVHGQFSSYEPELFPGLIYRMLKPRVVLLIFVSGKIVFTGAKSRNDINECLETIYPILQSFRKN